MSAPIAVTQQMLEALRLTADNIRHFPAQKPYEVWLSIVENAIAKAEGRES